jgi:tetratricopeptide (TPR) repeat protein
VEDAVHDFTLAAEAAPDALKAGLYQRSVDVLSEKGRHEELLPLLQKITSGGVRAPELLSALGDEQVRAGQLAEAVATYREAAGKSPKDPTLWELVAELHRRLHQPDEAVAAYRESLKVKNRSTVHVALARMAMERLDRAEADKELSLALDSASGEEGELKELAELLMDLDRKADALRILASLAAEPGRAKDVDFQLRTARLAQELKDTAVMTAACARVTAAAPTPAAPVGLKGKTVRAKGTAGAAPKCP